MAERKILWWLYLSVFLTLILGLHTIGKRLSVPISGDEPHYLIMADSLIHDRDFDVKNDYQLGYYFAFYPDTIDAHINTSQFNDQSNHWYSIHFPGLPIIIAIPFLISGKVGAMAVMTFFSVSLLFLVYFWTMRITGNRKLAILGPVALSSLTFFLGLTARIYPDLVIANCLLASILLMEKKEKRPIDLLLFGLLAGFSFWLHIKSVLFLITALLIVMYEIMGAKKSIVERISDASYLLLPFLLLVIPFELKLHQWYDVWLANQIYSGNGQPFNLGNLRSLLAILFDSVKGLIINNPITLLIFAALPYWFFENKKQLLRVCLIIFPSIIIFSTFPDWGAGWSPTGRYTMEILPVLVPAVVILFGKAKSLFWKIFLYIFLSLQCILGILWIIFKPAWTSDTNIFYNKLSEHFFHFNLANYFPRFLINGATLVPADKSKLVVSVVIAAGFFLVGLILSYNHYLKTKNG